MEVILAKHNGFCMGVKNAVDTARRVYGEGVYIFGELIHNESVINDISKLGTKTIESPNEVESGTVIIRSHGAKKSVLDQLEKKGIKVINCTCPFVMKIQNIVKEYYGKGFQIVIFGKKNHPEVVGINGYCEDTAIIADGDFDVDFLKNHEKVCLVAQTTASNEKFENFFIKISKIGIKTLEVFRTICYTTRERQNEVRNLAKVCDLMIVLGGEKSSNTKKLIDICKEQKTKVIFASDPQAINYKILRNYLKVGIVSGASTPNEQSMEVYLTMAELNNVNVMEEAVAQLDEKQTKFKKGQKIVATISSATDEGLALYINNTKKEIMLSKSELNCSEYDKEAYSQKVGDEIEVMIVGLNPVVLSEKAILKQKEEEEVLAKIEAGEIFTVVIDAHNKGGLTAKLGSYSVFVPSSQIKIGFVKDLEKFVGKTLRLKCEKIEKNERRKQIVASQRVILEAEKAVRDAEREAKENAFFDSIAEGEVVEGTVVRFAQFGAFVDVNGFDCLAHISDLSWTNAKTPADVLEIGKTYHFTILKCDRETKKVSIGYKQLQPKPWQLAGDKYAIDDVVKGKVVRIVSFGAFVEVEKGIDGLVHVSQISHEWLENPTSVLKVGDEVEAKVLDIDVEKEKMTLSIKALAPAPENTQRPRREKAEGEEGEDKPRRERRPRREKTDDGEPRGWHDDMQGGASIFELLGNK